MYVMFFAGKLLCFLMWTMFLSPTVFSGEGLQDIETGRLGLSSIEMTAQPIQRTLILDDSDESKSDETRSDVTTNGGIDSVLLGNQDITFSTPCLERYSKASAIGWNFLYSWLKDLEYFAIASATGLTTCANFFKSDTQVKFVVYAIQLHIVASILLKLHAYSEKVMPVREKQALAYEKQNKLNLIKEADNISPILINGVDASKNEEVFSTPCMAGYYGCVAVGLNILWDQIGVLYIICDAFAGSILNYTQLLDEKERAKYVVVATLFGVAGAFFHSYAKHLEKKTKIIEKKAENASNYVKHKKRMEENSAAAATGSTADNDRVSDMV